MPDSGLSWVAMSINLKKTLAVFQEFKKNDANLNEVLADSHKHNLLRCAKQQDGGPTPFARL